MKSLSIDIIIPFLIGISTVAILLPGISNFQLANLHFYILLLIATIDFFNGKRISLNMVWISAFMFIILSDMLQYDYSDYSYDWPIRFLLSANNVVIASYYFFHVKKSKQSKWSVKPLNHIPKNRFLPLIVILYAITIALNLQSFLSNLVYGSRANIDETSSIGGGGASDFFKIIPLFLPSLIAFYCRKKSKLLTFLLCLPLFIIIITDGTRFKILFSIIPYIFLSSKISTEKIRIRQFVFFSIVLLALVIGSNIIKQTRVIGLRELSKITLENSPTADNKNSNYFSAKIAAYGSPETIVEMTKYANIYFKNHPLQYGKNSSFILYFWIPRSVWPDKPTMLDNWLPNYFMSVSQAYSSASGFSGELRADFGYFSFFFFIIIGMGLSRLDKIVYSLQGQRNNHYRIAACFFYPFVFFFVRSPVTSTINIISIFLWLYLIKHITIKKQNRYNNKKTLLRSTQ